MAARLTDRQKKKIVADYLETESYNATAKINGVSKDTVKRVLSLFLLRLLGESFAT